MTVDLVPIVMFTGMFSMIFGIAYLRNRENMALIEKGLNPRNRDVRPRPFLNLKWGLLLIGSGLGLLFAYIIDNTIIKHDKQGGGVHTSFTIGGHHNPQKIKVLIKNDSSKTTNDDTLSKSAAQDQENNNDAEEHSITEFKSGGGDDNPAIYIALIAIGGGLGLFFSYRIEKKEWLDKTINS